MLSWMWGTTESWIGAWLVGITRERVSLSPVVSFNTGNSTTIWKTSRTELSCIASVSEGHRASFSKSEVVGEGYKNRAYVFDLNNVLRPCGEVVEFNCYRRECLVLIRLFVVSRSLFVLGICRCSFKSSELSWIDLWRLLEDIDEPLVFFRRFFD